MFHQIALFTYLFFLNLLIAFNSASTDYCDQTLCKNHIACGNSNVN